ncbi:Transcription initiation factor TFIID subunit 13 [Trapelia coarctata]|nr:Transcription initiation factor TFIID subunit 13 [Trapelia coarctata]
MTEPRARAARHKGQLNFEAELRGLLYAYGDDIAPLPETVRILDEIVTDFIIETCHQAGRSASYSNRQKIKVDDFKFAIRGNEAMLGRVQELLGMDRELKEARKQFDIPEGKAGLEKGKVGERGRGRGRGRPRGSGREKAKGGEGGGEEDKMDEEGE